MLVPGISAQGKPNQVHSQTVPARGKGAGQQAVWQGQRAPPQTPFLSELAVTRDRRMQSRADRRPGSKEGRCEQSVVGRRRQQQEGEMVTWEDTPREAPQPDRPELDMLQSEYVPPHRQHPGSSELSGEDLTAASRRASCSRNFQACFAAAVAKPSQPPPGHA